MKQDYSIRKMFLEEIMLHFISEYKKRYSPRMISLTGESEKSKETIETSPMNNNMPMNMPQNTIPQPQAISLPPMRNQIQQRAMPPQMMSPPPIPQRMPFPERFQQRRIPMQMAPQRGPPNIMNFPQQAEEHVSLGPEFGKIVPIIRDPSVMSLECPGPGKNILANKSGTIQTTPITLTKSEIEDILSEVSKQTKIPVIPGVFKAAMGEFIITAVVSEFVGTRFIIQKRMPTVPPFRRY